MTMIDVPCLEVCVYCRDVSTKVSVARRHDCNKGHVDGQETDVRSLQRASRRDQLVVNCAVKMDDMARQSSYRGQEGSVAAPLPGHQPSRHAWGDESIPQQGRHATQTQPPHADQSEMSSQHDALGAVSDPSTLMNSSVDIYNPLPVIQPDLTAPEYASIFDFCISSSAITPHVTFNQ